jgi:prefoldin subunit 5
MSMAEQARLSELKARVNVLEEIVRALQETVSHLLEAQLPAMSAEKQRDTLHLRKNG